MFRYVKLHNYKSLVDFEVDLTGKKKSPRKMVLVYGENGVGKSNFATAFYTLLETMQTMSMKKILEELLAGVQEIDNQEHRLRFQDAVVSRFKDIGAIISSDKTVNTTDDMILEYGFRYNNKNGRYILQISNTEIVRERLEYVQNKNQIIFFEIVNGQITVDNIFKENEYTKEINSLVGKYWGKHSLLAILTYEIEENSISYTQKNVPSSLLDVITFFRLVCVKVKEGVGSEKTEISNSIAILSNLFKGTISEEKAATIDNTENLINIFFTSLYSDVKQAYYEKEHRDGKIHYTLYLKKLIHNRLVNLNFKVESTGTQRLLTLLPFFLAAADGRTVIIDELDSGIHDLLVNSILVNLHQYIKGQIIITTHNTMLLESELSKDCVYIFNVDKNAHKELLPLSAFEERIHPNLNIRKRYLKGMYGGTPISMDVDFASLLNSLG